MTAVGVAPKNIVVVGASVAGLAAVDEARRLGFDGSITVVGDEAHEPYDRPPLTKSLLAGQQTVADCALRQPAWQKDMAVEMRLGTSAARLDLRSRSLELTSGPTLPFDGLVVATGATPRTLPGPSLDGVFTLRTLDDALALRATLSPSARVVVVGGGFIGAEVASTARRLGANVTIVESDELPLARAIGPEIATLLAEVHTDEGVVLRCGVPVAGVEGTERVERVRLADGSAIDADVVVIGLGVRPSTDWLDGSGLTVDNGVVCDAFCRASAPGVVAAGDVARWDHPRLGSVRIEHWENAVTQGRAAAHALVDSALSEPYAPVPYVWSDQYDDKIQMVGMPHPDDAVVVATGSPAERRFVALYTRGDTVTGAISFNQPATIARIRRRLRNDLTIAEVLEGAGSGAPSHAATGQ